MRIFLLVIVFFSASCTSKYYQYDIKMVQPPSERLYFENDTMSISFEFRQKFIHIEVYNKLEDGIRINWDELSISDNGVAQRVVHYQTGVARINDVQPPTTIPPKSKLEDGLIPTNKIIPGNGLNLVAFKDIYPLVDNGHKKTRKYALSKKGQKVVVFFPYYLKGVYHSKTFEFLIADVIQSKKKPKKSK